MKKYLALISILAAALMLMVGASNHIPSVLAQAGPSGSFIIYPYSANPCENPSAPITYLTASTTGTTAVQLVALSGTTKVYVCSMYLINTSGTTPTFSLVQGTGTNCATGQTIVVPAVTLTAATLTSLGQLHTVGVAGNALCYLQTGTTPITAYMLTYTQQ